MPRLPGDDHDDVSRWNDDRGGWDIFATFDGGLGPLAPNVDLMPEPWPGRETMSPDPSSPNFCRDAPPVVIKPPAQAVVIKPVVIRKRKPGRYKDLDARRAYQVEWMRQRRALARFA